MVKSTQTIRRQTAHEFLSVFNHFVGLALKVLNVSWQTNWNLHVHHTFMLLHNNK